MKLYSLGLLFLLNCFLGFAQKQTSKWYFGNNAAIDFISGSPVEFSGSAMTMLEGVSSIADTNGVALFYTNGSKVWNVNNIQMPNGIGLLGDNNSAQSALIVPDPGNPDLYYIFTTPTNGTGAMRYSVVDMTLQGGLGDVTAKNVFLFNTSTEKVTAVRHANGTDIWVIGHEFNTSNFFSFLVTPAGINLTPVITAAGSVHSGVLGFAGYMKAGHHGSKLAYANTLGGNIVELLDFDNSTGVPSNPVLFNNINEAYGIEFSPDDSKLYATSENPGLIYQWDVNAGSPAAIIASQTVIATVGAAIAALQLAYDGKIYVAHRYSNFISVINDPNALGLSSNFVNSVINLNFGINEYGLPNFFQSYFVADSVPPVTAPVVSFQSSDTSFCGKQCLDFFDLSTNNPTSWQWLFPGADSTSSNMQNPVGICYNSYGNFDVTLIACNSGGCDTLHVTNFINEYQTPPVPLITGNFDTLFCTPAYSYQWFNANGLIQNANGPYYVYSQQGSYYVIVTDSNGCASSSLVIYTGIDENQPGNQSYSVYPNPSNGEFTISAYNYKNENVICEIADVTGRIVFRKVVNNFPYHHMPQVNLESGVYLVSIKTKSEQWNKKIIINL